MAVWNAVRKSKAFGGKNRFAKSALDGEGQKHLEKGQKRPVFCQNVAGFHPSRSDLRILKRFIKEVERHRFIGFTHHDPT